MHKADVLQRLRKGARGLATLILTLGCLRAGGWALYVQILGNIGNIHAVTPGVVYRSAQLNGNRLADTLAQFQIKSVINLRGENVGEAWYTDELKVTSMHGAQHCDVRMGAKERPDAKTVKRVFEILRTAPRPMLIHCNSGSDRTGLVAAVYKYFIEGRPAEEELSPNLGDGRDQAAA